MLPACRPCVSASSSLPPWRRGFPASSAAHSLEARQRTGSGYWQALFSLERRFCLPPAFSCAGESSTGSSIVMPGTGSVVFHGCSIPFHGIPPLDFTACRPFDVFRRLHNSFPRQKIEDVCRGFPRTVAGHHGMAIAWRERWIPRPVGRYST